MQNRQIGIIGVVLCMLVSGAFAAEAALEGQPISSVQTAGNVTISRTQILATVRTRPGQMFSSQRVAEDVQRLAKMEGVDTAYYNAQLADGQVELTYVIVERNLVRLIVLSGNDKISDSKILSELGIKQGDYLDTFAARAGVETIRQLYEKKGYADVDVVLDEARLVLGEVVYQIDEGARIRVESVRFEGNQVLEDKALKKVVKTKPRKLVFWKNDYRSEQVQEDVEKLIEVYRKQSFLDAEVRAETNLNEKQTGMEVVFQITEGPVYLVDSIAFSGHTFYSEPELRQETKLTEDFYFSPDRLDFDTQKILNKYRQQGFLNATVAARRTFLDNDRVRLEYDIEEGERFRIGEITITGNTITQDRVIRRVLDEEKFSPGQWYDAAAARGDGEGELEKVVRQSAVLESAVIVPTGDEPGVRDAVVQAAEGQTGMVMLGAGVASDSGLIGQISFDQRNFDISNWPEHWSELFNGKSFRGAGQRFRISLSPGTEWSTYLVSFTEPYLYDRPISLEVTASDYIRLRESYDEERLGLSFGFAKRYQDNWRRGISFRLQDVDIADLDLDAPSEIVDVKGGNMLFGTRLWIGKDTTDSRFLPSRGYNFDAGYEQVAGDHTFGVLDATQRWYRTLREDLVGQKTVLETKLHGATVIGDAPPFERFYGGGIGSIRGFDYRGISPRGANDDPIGSDWIVVGSGEVAVPLGSDVFSWLFFTDVGAIDTGGIRASVGTGIQIMIPQWFGPVPMRFELGLPIMKDDDDETQVFSFSAGALF